MIPKLQYKNYDNINGSTSGVNTIVLDTVDNLEVDMLISGTGVTTGTKIQSIDTGTLTITTDQNVSATTNEPYGFYFELEFDYPPEQDDKVEEIKVNQTISTSRSGNRQYLTRYIERIRPLKFSFLNRAQTEFLETMFADWFSTGGAVRYFDDKTINTYKTYYANKTDFSPSYTVGTNELYSVEIEFVRL